MTDARILLSKVDRTLAYDPFLALLYQVLEEASARGYDFWVTLLFRTYAEQMRLYFQGRTLPGKIVTKARGGESAHCFGLAADLTHDSDLNKPGLQPDWDSGNYEILGELCAKYGLAWGRSYGDMPHVQWAGYETALELAPLRRLVHDPSDFKLWLPYCWQYVENNA